MDINKILEQLDELFRTHQIDKIEDFLNTNIKEANEAGDAGSVITLDNELIGFLRDTSQYEKAVLVCGQVLNLMEQVGLKDSVPYATTLLNVANAFRAAGKLEDSENYYHRVFELYQDKLDANDFRYASLHNNMSLMYQEKKDYESACESLQNALLIALKYPEARIEVATTYTNLAMSELKLQKLEQAVKHLEKAFELFEMDEEKDYHYSAALSAMGEAKYLAGEFKESVRYYKKALAEIDRNVGHTQAYEITLHNMNAAMEKIASTPMVNQPFHNGMELCEHYYEQYGIPMIREKFPQFEHVIAVGLVGEGSECFGFDDEVSRDHDFGPGFCLWLTDAVYDMIGIALQAEYDKLPSVYMGISRQNTVQAGKRVGVFRIGDFYEHLIGTEDVPSTQSQWLYVEDYQLAAATNGKIFRDELGEFSRIRKELLRHYPEEVRVKKIAREAALMAQSGQYNYSRMFYRDEIVTAHIALSEFMKHTMSMVYLLNKSYAPYYKWMHKGMSRLMVLTQVRPLLDELSQLSIGDVKIPSLIEAIVSLILNQLKKQGLTTGDDTYLEHHTRNILGSIETDPFAGQSKEELIEQIVSLEWKAFDRVINEGGRASCQDNFGTFSIMRKSQFMAWPKELIASYIADFMEANANNWNLITEKYGRMMESTDPKGYAGIKDSLPEISARKAVIIEEIVKLQVEWMEQFAVRYPKAADSARVIHTWEDTLYDTSYETYLRGELSTYSDDTLRLYAEFIVELAQSGSNLAEMIIKNTAILYGYNSLDEMEV